MYISTWIIIIAIIVAVYYFAKSRKKNTDTKMENLKFIGRHQQLYSVKKFLGQNVPDLELQITINNINDIV